MLSHYGAEAYVSHPQGQLQASQPPPHPQQYQQQHAPSAASQYYQHPQPLLPLPSVGVGVDLLGAPAAADPAAYSYSYGYSHQQPQAQAQPPLPPAHAYPGTLTPAAPSYGGHPTPAPTYVDPNAHAHAQAQLHPHAYAQPQAPAPYHYATNMTEHQEWNQDAMQMQDAAGSAVGTAGATNGLRPIERPPHGSEVFVGGMPPDVEEEELRQFFSGQEPIFELRVVRDKTTGSCKGYGFVVMHTREAAAAAAVSLNGRELKGKKVRTTVSQSKHRLFLGNIPRELNKQMLAQTLQAKGLEGVETIDMPMDVNDSARNRGFAFVEWYNHACAEHARKFLSHPNFTLGGRTLTVNWAEPRIEGDPNLMAQVKVVYVRNLPEGITEARLQELFGVYGAIEKIIVPQAKPGEPRRDYAFVHFTDRACALRAIEECKNLILDGREIQAELSKARAEGGPRKQQQQPAAQAAGHTGGANPVMFTPPAGSIFVPVNLANGQIGYVLQPTGGQPARPGPAVRNTGNQPRYRPY